MSQGFLWRDVPFSSPSSILYIIKSYEDRGQTEIGKLNNQNDDLDFRRHDGLKSSVLTSTLVLVLVLQVWVWYRESNRWSIRLSKIVL